MPTHDLSRLEIEFAGASDVGMLRENNEDAWWAGSLAKPAEGSQEDFSGSIAIADGAWLGVCDGLGGANAGEVASGLAITEVHGALAKFERGNISLAQAHEALLQSNAAINQVANSNLGWIGMGTTLSFVWAERGGAMLGQVGDSRIYRLRDKRLQEVSPDHSPVGRLRQSGRLTEDEARAHPTRHVIDQCLGGDDTGLRPDCLPLELAAGDVLLLCSDGLTDGVVDAELASMMGEAADGLRTLPDVARLLIKSANRQSGRDNATVIVGHVIERK